MVLIYGLYRIPHDRVAERMAMAREFGIRHFDTAQLYGNETQCAAAAHTGEFITTKIYAAATPAQITKMAFRSQHRFDRSKIPIGTMLLHRPMSNDCWAELVKRCAKIPVLGISNYDYNGLQSLLEYCEAHGLRKPEVHQIELHPFVQVEPMLELCRTHQITVQAHTILAQGKFFDFMPLRLLAENLNQSPAALMVSWAQAKASYLCLGTTSPFHLEELIQASTQSLDPEAMAEINSWQQQAPYRFYERLNRVPFNLNGIPDPEALIDQLVAQLKVDAEASVPSDLCDQMPLSGHPYRTVGVAIGVKLFPEASYDLAIGLYRNLIKRLRNTRIKQRQMAKQQKKGVRMCMLPRGTGSYSELILHPTPMPVEVTDPTQFIPIFDYLMRSPVLPQADTTFVKGSIFPDGRLDLCKQVVGPTSIQQLCEVVAQSTLVRHFLLGNNIALQENEAEGAEAMAKLLADNTKPIETWYLAGNCIGPVGIEIMARALQHNYQAKALWLKRNPIGPLGAGHLNRMLKVNQTLKILDLHNCALGDSGLAELLASPCELRGLKHLYLDANGIESIQPLSAWCQEGTPVTLYLSINRLGDRGVTELAAALVGNKHLRRLCLASTGFGNVGLEALVDALLTCPRLLSVNLGCYKSSADMGEHPGNLFDSEALPAIYRLLTTSPTLQYFNCIGSQISKDGLASIPRLEHISMDLGSGRGYYMHAKESIRRLKHPRRVVHIDSIYRGKM